MKVEVANNEPRPTFRVLIASLLISGTVNLATLILLALVVFDPPPVATSLVLFLLPYEAPEQQIDEVAIAKPEPPPVELEKESTSSAASTTETLTPETPISQSGIGVLPSRAPAAVSEVPEEASRPAPAAAQGARANDEGSSGASGITESWLGWDDVAIGPGVGLKKVSYFGIDTEGERIVFIVDASGSMHGERFKEARSELLYCLENLTADQQFAVFFFNDHRNTRVFPEDGKMVAADADTKADFRRWVADIRPRGYTHPTRVMRRALKMRPDVVFFLSDGEIPPNTVRVAGIDNDGTTVIHALGFKSREGEDLLTILADQNGGEYRFVE